eukprot:COSAG06_NODE_98_length_24155_cov_29.681784_14_plen_86_part_00
MLKVAGEAAETAEVRKFDGTFTRGLGLPGGAISAWDRTPLSSLSIVATTFSGCVATTAVNNQNQNQNQNFILGRSQHELSHGLAP